MNTRSMEKLAGLCSTPASSCRLGLQKGALDSVSRIAVPQNEYRLSPNEFILFRLRETHSDAGNARRESVFSDNADGQT